MPTLTLQGTSFTLSVLKAGRALTTKIAVENEYIHYESKGKWIALEELQELITSACRLLAGGYSKEYTLSLDGAGLAVDFYPYTEDGQAVSRKIRRENDCRMAVRFLMRARKKKAFLGGVYTLLLHREEIELFVRGLEEELIKNGVQRVHGKGKYRFVGVSPLGYKGCNYLYFDEKGEGEVDGYVWVRMGRHDTLQMVYVDSVRYYKGEDVPYDPQTVKRVLRKATKEEIEGL